MASPTSLSKIKPDLALLYKEIADLRTQNEELRKDIVRIREEKTSPEEALCLEQLQFLKEKSEQAELTLEETKKSETFIKLLQQIRSQGKKKEDLTEDLSTDQLLDKLV